MADDHSSPAGLAARALALATVSGLLGMSRHHAALAEDAGGMWLTIVRWGEMESCTPRVNRTRARWAPTMERIRWAWSDEPFAVVVPFTAPASVSATVTMRLSITGFEARVPKEPRAAPPAADEDVPTEVVYPQLQCTGLGLARLDGQPLFRTVTAQDGTVVEHKAMARFALAGSGGEDCRLGEILTAGRVVGDLSNLTERPDRKPATLAVTTSNLAAPVPMAVWLSFDMEKLREVFQRGATDLDGALDVAFDEVIFLDPARGGARATAPGDAPQNLRIRVRQNGWVMDGQPECRRDPKWESPSQVRYEDGTIPAAGEIESAIETGRNSLKVTHRVKETAPGHGTVENTLELRMPPVVWDHAPSALAAVTVTCRSSDDAVARRYAPWKSSYRDDVFRSDGFFRSFDELGEPAPGGGGAVVQRFRQTPGSHDGVPRPPDPGEQWLPAYFHTWIREWTGERRRFGEVRRGYVEMDTPSGMLPARWVERITPRFRRLSEIEDNREAPERPAPPPDAARRESGDDGYWAWRTQFVKDAEAARQQIEDDLAALDRTTRELRALDAQHLQMFAEFHALPADEDLFGDGDAPGGKGRARIYGHLLPEMLRANMAKHAALIHEKQAARTPIAGRAKGTLQALLDGARAQAARSGDRRPDVPRTAESLEREILILEMRLLDASGELGTDASRRRIEEIERRSDAAGRAAAAYSAMCRWERAKVLDRKAFLHTVQNALRGPELAPPSPEGKAERVGTDVRRLLRGRTDIGTRGLLGDAAVFWGLLDAADPRARASEDPFVTTAISERHEAVIRLREILRKDPGDLLARSCLCEVEGWYVGVLLRKVESERRLSVAAFESYLDSHGIPRTDTGETSLPDFLWEFSGYISGSGPINIAYTALDTPGLVAGETEANLAGAVRDAAALRLTRKLLRKGRTLAQILALGRDAMPEVLELRTPSGAEVPADRTWRLVQDLQTCWKGRPDFRLFAEAERIEQMDAFERSFQANVHLFIDPEQGWGEWIGELGSPRNLFLLGMGSRVGQDAISSALRLDALGARLAGTAAGTRLAASIAAYRANVAASSAYRQFFAGADRMAAAMVLYVSAGWLAERSDVPGARLLVDLIGAMNAHDMVADVLARAALRRETARRAIALVGREADEAARRAGLVEKAAAEIEAVADEVGAAPAGGSRELLTESQSQRLAEADRLLAEAAPPPPPPPSGPAPWIETPGSPASGVPAADAQTAMHESARAASRSLRVGDVKETGRALGATQDLVTKVKEGAKNTQAVVKKAQASVDATGSVAVVRESPTSGALPTIQSQSHPRAFGDAAVHAEPGSGPIVKEAEDALRREDWDGAERAYRRAAEAARAAGREFDAEELQRQIREVMEARRLSAEWAARTGPPVDAAIAKPIDAEDVAAVSRAIDAGTEVRILKRDADPLTNEINVLVFSITDDRGVEWVVKVGRNVAADLDDECWATGLLNAMTGRSGVRAPEMAPLNLGARTLTLGVKDGAAVTESAELVGSLVRRAPGKAMADGTEAGLLAAKRKWAFQAVFRSLIGDSDGHLGNQLLAEGGTMEAIDFGMGRVGRAVGGGAKQAPGFYDVRTEEQFVDVCMGISSIDTLGGDMNPNNAYRWKNHAEAILDFEHDVAPAVKTIREFVHDEGPRGARAVLKARMEQTGKYTPELLDEAIDALRKRADHLEDAWKRRLAAPEPVRSNTRLGARPGARTAWRAVPCPELPSAGLQPASATRHLGTAARRTFAPREDPGRWHRSAA